jgi:hypothetical protein
MRVYCKKCGLSYNDTYRWTFCPHDKFPISESAATHLRERGVSPFERDCDKPRRDLHGNPLRDRGAG